MEAISVAPERRWSLGSLAAALGVSPWHLAHGFRAETGLSLYQFVLRTRLATTLSPVLDTNAELARVALDAGFASHSHFTARFRSLFGRTPRELRRDANTKLVSGLRKIVTARV
jgi:AraC-like DNA-binding protein